MGLRPVDGFFHFDESGDVGAVEVSDGDLFFAKPFGKRVVFGIAGLVSCGIEAALLGVLGIVGAAGRDPRRAVGVPCLALRGSMASMADVSEARPIGHKIGARTVFA